MTNKDSSQAQLGDLLSLMDLLLGARVKDYLQEGRRHKTAASLTLPHHPENFMKAASYSPLQLNFHLLCTPASQKSCVAKGRREH